MKQSCLTCGKSSDFRFNKWLIIPGFLYVPNEYGSCEDHKDIFYSFEDIYENDGKRKEKLGQGKIIKRE